MKHNIIGLWFIAFLIVTNAAFSQKILSLTVTDGITKEPLAGASISFGNYKTQSTAEGRFSISCQGKEKLVITYIGYKSFSLEIADCVFPETIELFPQEHTLDSIEVTTSSSPYKKLLYQPASITKVNRTELNRGNGLFLDDAIQTNVTGVTMNRRSVSGGQQLNIRGYGNGARGTRGISSNFDGQGYKVYLNGIAVTDAEGITVFDDIDFALLQNVEITKGPAGSLYGLAIAGAVNLTTVKPEKGKPSIAYTTMSGNYGLSRHTTTFQAAGEKSSLLINYGVQRSKGFLIHNASHKKFVSVVSEFTPNTKNQISSYFGYSDSYDERAGELTITQYETNDYSGNPEYIKRNGHSHVNTFRAGIGYTHHFAKEISNSTTVFGTAFNSDVSSAGGWTDKGSMNIGLRSVFNLKFSVGKEVLLSGVTGLELQKQIANTMGYSMKQNPKDSSSSWVLGVNPYWVINAQTSNVYTVASTGSWFSEWTLSLPKDLALLVGIGSSRLGLYLNDRFNPELVTRPSTFEKTYGNMAAPHFSINKVIRKKISVFANYSVGFKAPVSSYFYITVPAVATNPPTPANGSLNDKLQPEKGTQIELGTRGEFLRNKLSFEIIAFQTQFRNKMTAIAVSSPLSPNTTLYSYMVNGGSQIHKGLELTLKYTAYESSWGALRLLRPFLNLTRNQFTYGDQFIIEKSATLKEDYSNKAVAAVAKYAVNAGVDIQFNKGLSGNLTYNYRDKMPITSLNDFYASGYNLLNGKLSYRKDLGRHLQLDLSYGINNITGTKYYLMVFANQLPDAYIPAPRKANSFSTIQVKYKF